MPVQANGSEPAPADTPQEAAKQRVTELQGENTQLQEAVHAHAVVDQAIGVILAIGQLTPDEGWNVLREISQRTNIKLRHVSELIIEWARTGKLCADIRAEPDRQLAPYARTSRRGD